MNPLVLFLPVYRASITAYLAGIAILAFLDFLRIQYGLGPVPRWVGMLAIWFFVFSLHANRRRHAGRGIGIAFLPLGLAIVAKGIGAFFAMIPGAYSAMTEFAAENGVDTDDQQALAEALNDPGFQQEFQRAMQNDPELLQQLMSATGPGSFIGFWLVIAVFAIWFARMARPGA
ncbi:hypothetical protein [Maricaulis sp.]|uniref:hypothetical protein n=1 Tax=Maricaulis sp. TaxID=1486257 RepID=UPI00260DD6AD|nr:hypothetical protein [Maricaulis sp.]